MKKLFGGKNLKLLNGDTNSIFFHIVDNGRKNRNMIEKLKKDNGTIIVYDIQIEEKVLGFLKSQTQEKMDNDH